MPKLKDIKKKAENRLDLDSVPNEIVAKLKAMPELEKGYKIILIVKDEEYDNVEDMPILENHYTSRFLDDLAESLENLGYDDTEPLVKDWHIWKREGNTQVKEGKITYFPRHYPTSKVE
jgi:hypothetical protein